MSDVVIALFTGCAVCLAVFVGELWFQCRRANEFMRGVLAGQRQAELCGGRRATEVNVGHAGDESWALLDKRQARSPAQPHSLDL